MLRITKTLVLASWAAAAALEIWSASRGHPGLWRTTMLAFAGGALAGYLVPQVISGLLLFVYAAPALISAATGRFYVFDYSLWWAPFAGAVIANVRLTHWDLPSRWRLPVILWASSIALSWPVIALRESEWSLDRLLFGPPLLSASTGMYHLLVVSWIASVAGLLLLGIIWLDYLCRVCADRARLRRRVLWPLGVGAVATFPVAIYQGWVDLSFLSGGSWPAIHRAAGTLVDANAFGMVCAMWGVGWFALASTSAWLGRVTGWVVYAASWAALWATGSRTALFAGVIGLCGIVVIEIRESRLKRSHVLMAGVLATTMVVALQLFAPTASPLSRIRGMFGDFSASRVMQAATSLWSRDTYGTMSTSMIREYPIAGVGIGMFNPLTIDFSRAMNSPAPPDNAQNWYRHQLAETGILGSMGWILWLLFVCAALLRRSQTDMRMVGAALLAFGMASLVGMPGQNLAVALTFWTFVAWSTGAAAHDEERRGSVLLHAGSVVILGLFLAQTVATARDLRPAFRAARFDYDFEYGFHFDPPGLTWSDKHGVAVLKAPKPWLKLTYWVEHPDAATNPVTVDIWRDHDRIVHRKLWNDVRVTKYVPVPGEGKRFVLEVKVDRTSRTTDGSEGPERGLSLKWEFVDSAPPGER